ncbi:9a8032c6-8aef-4c54-9504-7f657065a8d5 [Thermothielavioides terrestris]|uniref:9a8032c6-8aef-4c54-9504-7f657065a8d5 n=1 Tax=Thermothielavioides terrestris TaxID=2587410 RepID=A0A446BDR0_9PEZI|nr:9a8032c6-8aef-4c54-9504-7f657065a8d5 [Thermothielavioides terrestris]
MPRRTYTLTELLGLRMTRTSGDEVLTLSENPEFADILRRPGRESSSGSSCKPAAIRPKDDSSVTSDELVFKGTMSRRSGRDLARQASQNSIRHPVRDSVKDLARDNARRPARESDSEPARPTEWKYSGRSETEAAAAEPIPAPTGAPAQRDEGFQRFYKAVVSPTHVRVTAGGRIVPNTRGPPSPTSKRSSDNSAMDNQSAPDKPALSKPMAAPIGLGQPVPVVPQLVAGYPAGFQPMQAPISFVPMALGAPLPPGFSFAQSSLNPAAVAPMAPDGALKDMHNIKVEGVRSDAAAPNDKHGQAEIPGFFDGTKQYFYNGQLMYPVGAFSAALGSPMVPVQMVGIPHGVAPQVPGHYLQAQPAPPAPSAGTGTSYAPSNQSLSGIPPVVNHIVPANANFNAATAPPMSSIKLSDITKKQIASFKQSLKYHEDQLQYNRHQIDEKDMENKIQIIKGHIQRFEATLTAQLEYEEAQRRAAQEKEDKKPSQPLAAAEPVRIPSQPVASMAQTECRAPTSVKETDEAINRKIGLASHGLNANSGESGKAMFRSHAEHGLPNVQTLPSEAALAPIFQPRGYASTWTGSKYARELKAYEESEKGLAAAESKNLENIRLGEQRSVSQPFAASMAAGTHAEGNRNAGVQDTRSDRNTKAGGKQQSNLGVPYLLGTLPKGVNPRTARDQDYVYNRPLTDEERRARFLYWGKAPKSAVKGLPKYDGKHFYPPSPVKESAAEPVARGSTEDRKTDSDADPFRPKTPVQRGDGRGMTASEDNCAAGRLARKISFESQVNSSSEDFIAGGGPAKGRDDSTDLSSVGSAERRTENAVGKLWESVLKKGQSSSALSSTTAQGLLPHYTGNAAASLVPSLSTNQASSPRDGAPGKLSDVQDLTDGGGAPLSAVPEKLGENRPPNGVSSLEDQFKHLSMDATSRRNLGPAFGM